MEIEYVSTVTKDFESCDPKVSLTGKDLQIKKEMVEEDLYPGDPEYYSSLLVCLSKSAGSRKDCRSI